MCVSAILGVASIGMGIAGSVSSAISSRNAAQRQAAYYEYLAGQTDETIAEYKKYLPKQLDLIEGTKKRNLGVIKESAADTTLAMKRAGKEISGTQSVALAANQVVGTTVENIVEDTANKLEEDEVAIRYEADLKAWDLITQAEIAKEQTKIGSAMQILDLNQKASGYRQAAKFGVQAGDSALYSGLLSTLGSTARSVYAMGGVEGWWK
jgi:hypothetical protein